MLMRARAATVRARARLSLALLAVVLLTVSGCSLLSVREARLDAINATDDPILVVVHSDGFRFDPERGGIVPQRTKSSFLVHERGRFRADVRIYRASNCDLLFESHADLGSVLVSWNGSEGTIESNVDFTRRPDEPGISEAEISGWTGNPCAQ